MNMRTQQDGSDVPSGMKTLDLHFSLNDFDSGDEPDLYDDDFDCSCNVVVTQIAEGRFRVEEPTCVTPFGFIGPRLNFGDVIDATVNDDGSFALSEVVERADPWSEVFSAYQAQLDEKPVREVLDALVQAGGMWEFAVGSLTLQALRSDSDMAPLAWFVEARERLAELLGG